MFKTLNQDKVMILNKYHLQDQPFNSFKRMQYHGYDYDEKTGMNDQQMSKGLELLLAEIGHLPHSLQKAKAFEYVLDNARIDINQSDYFVGFYNWGRLLNQSTVLKWHEQAMSMIPQEHIEFLNRSRDLGRLRAWMDYDHSVPDWQALFDLGFAGLLVRIKKYKQKNTSIEKIAFYESLEITYEAIIRLLNRYYEYSYKVSHDKVEIIRNSLDNLRKGPPKTTYDCLMLIFIYFILSESVDSYQVRSLSSGLDYLLYPYYERDLASGDFTKTQIAEFIGYFFMQFAAIENYWGHPFYLGGSLKDGKTKVSELTYLILDVYENLKIYSPKIQIKYNRVTPLPFINKVLDMIRTYNASIVIIFEDNVKKSFELRGIDYDEYYDFDVKGCYEFSVKGKEVSTSPLYINLLADVNSVIFNKDLLEIDSYENFEAEYFKCLQSLFDNSIEAVNEIEKYLDYVNPSSMFSGTVEDSLKSGLDAYQNGSKYNMTAILINGLGSAVDSLMAVKHLVYDEKKITIEKLRVVLDKNWDGYDDLLASVRNLPHKYGNGDDTADSCAKRIADFIYKFQDRDNSRGGKYKIHIHSARMFIEFGKAIGATADGRKKGTETSKNASPAPGADINGVTGLINSAINMKPYRFTEGCGLDLMLHPSSTQNQPGLVAMKALLDVYDLGGGSSVQFNVVSYQTLKNAQSNPEQYKNLQVRVCGWNVLFTDMSKEEQDAYILRAQNFTI